LSIYSLSNTVDVLKNAISGSSTANDALAANVANAQTPNFHRADVSFKDALSAASGDPSSSDELRMTKDNPADLGGVTPGEFDPVTKTDEKSKMRSDGNNVDIDQEMAKLSMNADYGSMSTTFLKNQYAMFRQVIEV
jgi:flagellar basal-body rod protein FlgB